MCVSRSNEGARSSTSATPCRTGDGRPAGQRRARRAGSQRVIVFLVAFCSRELAAQLIRREEVQYA